MAKLGARAAILGVVALGACSDPSALPEDLAHAALALQPSLGHEPLLGPGEEGWRLPPTGDFNQDGLQDILWRDHNDNHLAVALMNGTRLVEMGPSIPGPPGADWVVVNGAVDFNLDGMSDVLWYDAPRNRIQVWLMRGTVPLEQGPVIQGPPGDGWTCIPAGDFNLDGMADVLWYNPRTNRMIVWLMSGTEPLERGPELPGPGDGWLADFASDFDRDGMADVFWYDHTANRMAVWLMAGTAVREAGPVLQVPVGDGWILAGAGDFNRDGVIDALWYSSRTQRMSVSLMWGTGLLEQGPEIPGPSGGDWIVGDAADCNGDGMSDVLWLSTEPLESRVWLMDGTTPMVKGESIPGPRR